MTLDELIQELSSLASRGNGKKQVLIYDRDKGISGSIEAVLMWRNDGELDLPGISPDHQEHVLLDSTLTEA